MALFIGGSAAAYAVAMILMKFWHVGSFSRFALGGLIAVAMLYAVFLEIEALRGERLAIIYVAILGIECVLITLASVYWFGEQFSLKEIAGMTLVIVGTAITWA